MITLICMTDGRKQCMSKSMLSLERNVGTAFFERKFIFDDSADREYAEWLDLSFPDFDIIHHPQRLGFCGAVHNAWKYVKANTSTDFIFHIEDDFTYNQPLYLGKMMAVLRLEPWLAQLALLRQPVNEEERRAGGIFGKHGEENFHQKSHSIMNAHWVEHDIFWTTNPSLFRREILDEGWPTEPQCEGMFSIALRMKGFKFGFWGKKDDAPRITHIGNTRAGTGY